jgi:hypothetical protein
VKRGAVEEGKKGAVEEGILAGCPRRNGEEEDGEAERGDGREEDERGDLGGEAREAIGEDEHARRLAGRRLGFPSVGCCLLYPYR